MKRFQDNAFNLDIQIKQTAQMLFYLYFDRLASTRERFGALNSSRESTDQTAAVIRTVGYTAQMHIGPVVAYSEALPCAPNGKK